MKQMTMCARFAMIVCGLWLWVADKPILAGDLFVGSVRGTIYEFTPSGTRSTFASGLGEPDGTAFDSNGNLFVADYGSGNIYELTPGGVRSTVGNVPLATFLAFAPTPTPEPCALALLAAGAVGLVACRLALRFAESQGFFRGNGGFVP
jgi:hypothetical protein